MCTLDVFMSTVAALLLCGIPPWTNVTAWEETRKESARIKTNNPRMLQAAGKRGLSVKGAPIGRSKCKQKQLIIKIINGSHNPVNYKMALNYMLFIIFQLKFGTNRRR